MYPKETRVIYSYIFSSTGSGFGRNRTCPDIHWDGLIYARRQQAMFQTAYTCPAEKQVKMQIIHGEFRYVLGEKSAGQVYAACAVVSYLVMTRFG